MRGPWVLRMRRRMARRASERSLALSPLVACGSGRRGCEGSAVGLSLLGQHVAAPVRASRVAPGGPRRPAASTQAAPSPSLRAVASSDRQVAQGQKDGRQFVGGAGAARRRPGAGDGHRRRAPLRARSRSGRRARRPRSWDSISRPIIRPASAARPWAGPTRTCTG